MTAAIPCDNLGFDVRKGIAMRQRKIHFAYYMVTQTGSGFSRSSFCVTGPVTQETIRKAELDILEDLNKQGKGIKSLVILSWQQFEDERS